MCDTVFNCTKPFHLTTTNTISKSYNNQRPQVDYFATNLSITSHADQDVIFEEISYLYDRTKTCPTYSVVFQGSRSYISTNLSTDDSEKNVNKL